MRCRVTICYKQLTILSEFISKHNGVYLHNSIKVYLYLCITIVYKHDFIITSNKLNYHLHFFKCNYYVAIVDIC